MFHLVLSQLCHGVAYASDTDLVTWDTEPCHTADMRQTDMRARCLKCRVSVGLA